MLMLNELNGFNSPVYWASNSSAMIYFIPGKQSGNTNISLIVPSIVVNGNDQVYFSGLLVGGGGGGGYAPTGLSGGGAGGSTLWFNHIQANVGGTMTINAAGSRAGATLAGQWPNGYPSSISGGANQAFFSLSAPGGQGGYQTNGGFGNAGSFSTLGLSSNYGLGFGGYGSNAGAGAAEQGGGGGAGGFGNTFGGLGSGGPGAYISSGIVTSANQFLNTGEGAGGGGAGGTGAGGGGINLIYKGVGAHGSGGNYSYVVGGAGGSVGEDGQMPVGNVGGRGGFYGGGGGGHPGWSGGQGGNGAPGFVYLIFYNVLANTGIVGQPFVGQPNAYGFPGANKTPWQPNWVIRELI